MSANFVCCLIIKLISQDINNILYESQSNDIISRREPDTDLEFKTRIKYYNEIMFFKK
jgi:hypothetical protein